mgnify:CR=1 FL=1
MIWKMSWRNAFKYRRKSLTVSLTVFFSILVFGFAQGFIQGFKDMSQKAIFNDIGHITVYAEGYQKRADLLPTDRWIDDPDAIAAEVRRMEGVRDVLKEIRLRVQAESGDASKWVILRGVETENDQSAYVQRHNIAAGAFPAASNEVLIGEALAEELGVSPGGAITVSLVGADGTAVRREVVVSGLFRTGVESDDGQLVIAGLSEAQALLGAEDGVTEIRVMLRDPGEASSRIGEIGSALSGRNVELFTWTELNQGLYDINVTMNAVIVTFLVILILVVSTGIINVQLTSIFERIRDFGTLRAIGLKQWQLMLILLVEAGILGFAGALAGTAGASALVYALSFNGIDLGAGAQDVSGLTSVIFPRMTVSGIALSLFLGIAISVASVLYPGWLAARMKVVKSLHYR